MLVVLTTVELALELAGVLEGAGVLEAEPEALDDPAEPPVPGLGPAMEVVMGPSSMKIPDQYQSSASASVPPLGRRSSPMCLRVKAKDQQRAR